MASIDVALCVLDRQLLDVDGRRCGNVDDLAIEDGVVVAILSGPGVWPTRAGWIGRVASRIGGDDRIRIPWSEVKELGSQVVLRGRAEEYGLGRGDDRLRPWIERLPGSSL